MPSPPCERASVRSTCVNGSKMLARNSGGMPTPESRMRNTTSSPSRAADSEMRPPFGVYFAALLTRFERICATRAKSPLSCSGSAGSCSDSVCRCASMFGLLVSIAAAMTCATSTVSILSSILPRVMRDTSSRSSTSRTSCFNWRAISSRAQAILRRVVLADAQDVHGVADRRQRIAQFVREHREELVLALVLFLDLAEQQRVVERGCAARRELGDHRERVGVETPRPRLEPERQHAEVAAADEQRHEHQRVHGKPARQRDARRRRTLGIAHDRFGLARTAHALDRLVAASGRRARRATRSSSRASGSFVDQAISWRSACPSADDERHDAHIGKTRHDEPRHLAQRRLEIERARERRRSPRRGTRAGARRARPLRARPFPRPARCAPAPAASPARRAGTARRRP